MEGTPKRIGIVMVAIGVLMVAYWAFGPSIEIDPEPAVPADTGQRLAETARQNADLPPGTAQVLLQIAAINEDTDSSYLLDALIEEVLQYGPSTPVLAAGSKIAVDATDYVSDDSRGTDLKEGMSAICIISYSQILISPSDSDKDTPGSSGRWKLATISNE